MQESRVTEERKFAILFAATILAARKLIDMDPDKPHPPSNETARNIVQ